MIKRTFEIIDPLGLHARPASLLTKKASSYSADIKIQYETKEVNLKSIMGVMALGVSKGESFTICVEGDEEESIMEALTQVLIENKLISQS